MPLISKRLRDSSSTGNSGYLKPSDIKDGDSLRFSLLTEDALDYYMFWIQEVSGTGRKPVRCVNDPSPEDIDSLLEQAQERWGKEYQRPITKDGTGKEPIKMASSVPVYNFEKQCVQVLEWSQSTITQALDEISQMEDYRDCMTEIDLVIKRTGQSKETRYSLNAVPRKKGATASIELAWNETKEKGFDLERLLDGGDPFKAAA
tara:strand:+ start:21 stop:632 length:612 start_codon:yes stop_codon:yes gene_type:complete